MERHYKAAFGDGDKIGKVLGRNIRIYYPEPPGIRATGDNIDIDLVADPSGLGVKPRRTTIKGRIETRQVDMTLGLADSMPPGNICPTGSYPFRELPKQKVTVPALRISINIDDVPGRVDRPIAGKANSALIAMLSVPLANLSLLGFENPDLDLHGDGDADVGFTFFIELPKQNIPRLLDLIHPSAKGTDRQSPLHLAWLLASGDRPTRDEIGGNLARLMSVRSYWPIARGGGWECMPQNRNGSSGVTRLVD